MSVAAAYNNPWEATNGRQHGRSGQSGTITIGSVGAHLNAPAFAPRADSITLIPQKSAAAAWAKICPVYRDWSFDVEMPMRACGHNL